MYGKFKMTIYWKALVRYGFVFWLLLCITDFLGITNVYRYSKDLDELYEKPEIVAKIEKRLEPHLPQIENSGIKFGWSLLLWNTLTFVISVGVCSVVWSAYNFLICYRNKLLYSPISSVNTQQVKSVSSKIPIMIKSGARSSDSNLHDINTKSRVETDKSCPNLLVRSGSNLSSITDITTKTTRTIYRRDLYFCEEPGLTTEQHLEKQCKKLKEELHRLQTSSLKEHALLSRKLDFVTKDRKEYAKQLTTAQKENRAAKQQLEELLQEKASLLKKLENATKEFKSHTKSKKFALAKLEEMTNKVDDLRQELEQVSRDKEILEKKLRLLETEYNKLHERYIASQQRYFTSNSNENLPERDENNNKQRQNFSESLIFPSANNVGPALQQTASVLASVSQTELDMKKIQEKIKELEKNLENLNISSNDMDRTLSMEQVESDLSMSALEHTTDSQIKTEGSGTTLSGFSSTTSPRQRYWSEKVAELIGKNKQKFAKIQALAMQVQEKARFLGNIRERADSSDDTQNIEEVSSCSEERVPKRMVSSSVAFKNFLKSLNKLDAAKQQLPSTSEVYF